MKVVSNTAISLDGRINSRQRRAAFLGSARDHARMSRLRADADAILVGGATFRHWPHAALPDAADRSRLRGRPWNVVVSRRLTLPLDADFFSEPAVRPLLLSRADVVGTLSGPGVEHAAWDGGGDDLPIGWILEQVERRGVQTLLVEAGGDLLFQFLAAGAIDEMYVTVCPLILGGKAPTLADGVGFDLVGAPRLGLRSAEVEGDEVFLHYGVRPES